MEHVVNDVTNAQYVVVVCGVNRDLRGTTSQPSEDSE
jgi:hypothetical protein